MDIEETRKYYSNTTRENCCTCDYCQNLIDEIKTAYPKVADYLETLGVNIEHPFEASVPIELNDEYWIYPFVQYLIVGDKNEYQGCKIDDIAIGVAKYHPSATYKGKYFIIEAGRFIIKRRNDKYQFD